MALFFKPHARGIPPFISAVLKSDLDAIESLVESGTDVNMQLGGFKETALHMACKEGDLDTIRLLLDKGADINALSFNRNCPLYVACYHDKEEAALLLIKQGCDINIQDVTHRSPLMLAIEKGLNTLTKTLVDNPTCDLTHFDRRKRNILHHAVIGRNVEAIKIMQRKKIIKYLSDQPDRLGVFPMLMAARKGYLNVMGALLSAGADPNVYDDRFPDTQTPLQEAILNGHAHIVKLLLKYGAKLEGNADEQVNAPQTICPILLSLMTNHERTDILQVLLEEGATVNVTFGDYTPLHLAVDQGYFRMARIIVLANCDLAVNKQWLDEYVPRTQNDVDRFEFFQWLEGYLDELGKPNRLSYWCRDTIRHLVQYKRPVCDQIYQLPLPPKLINFLLYRDVE